MDISSRSKEGPLPSGGCAKLLHVPFVMQSSATYVHNGTSCSPANAALLASAPDMPPLAPTRA